MSSQLPAVKDARIPRHRRAVAADAGLHRARDDLIERRIASQRVGQLARLSRVGAAQLDRRRRAAAFAVSGVHVQSRRGLNVTPAAGFNRLKT